MFSFIPIIMRKTALPAVLMMVTILAAGFLVPEVRAQIAITEIPMPEFKNQSQDVWINSKPLKKADLKGKVVLIEIWTSI